MEFELVFFYTRQATGALQTANVGPVNIATFVQVPFTLGAGFQPEHLLYGLLANLGFFLPTLALLVRVW